MLDSCQTTRASHSKDEIMLRKKEKNLTQLAQLHLEKNRKSRSSIFGLFLEFIKGGAQIPTSMTHTHSKLNYMAEVSHLLGFI